MSEIILVSSSQKTETLIIPETVNKLNGIYANTNITKVVFNKEITKWEDNFSGCPNLKSVVFPDSQEEIPANAFYNCEKLNSVVLPANLRRIGNRAFYNTALNNIDFPETLEHIGEEAFAKTKFKSITVPKSVRTLGWGSFSGVAEIEIYDSIDPDAKNASAKIDTDNGYPNSLVGYIGMGEAWAMWECAANHKWVNYTIIVKSAETDEIKYIVWMGSDPSQRKYYCFLSSAWGHNATFAFKELDEFFPKIKGAEHKVKVAQYRLEYPVDLSEEAKKKYESYIKRYAKKGE